MEYDIDNGAQVGKHQCSVSVSYFFRFSIYNSYIINTKKLLN